MFLRIMAVFLGLIGVVGVGLALVGLQRPPVPVQVQVAPAAQPAATAPAVEQHTILVAARALHAGNLVVPEDVTATEVPLGSEPAGSFADTVANRSTLRGAMVRQSLAANQPILADDVLNAGDRGFLAAVLAAGTRAVSVGVDSVSGAAGLIWPGDRVDLVLTQQIDDRDQPVDQRVSGETVLRDLRVIAVDQQLIQGGGGTVPGAVNTNRTITIEASPYDAERIAVASRLGRLSLLVRSATDDPQAVQDSAAGQPPIAWAGDVSPALRIHGRGISGNSIHVYHGAGTVDEVKF
jgi:pilus assembly protein CpaB